MLAYILLGIVGLIVVLLAVVALQPSTFRVTRSETVAAPPSAVFDHVDDLRRWSAWSPWEKVDPEMKRTFEGAPAGRGAVYRWDGNKNVGAGIMTIIESRPGELIRLNLEFLRPFAATNAAEFTFTPEGGGTLVTWTMSGRKNLLAKAMHLVINIDKMVGRQFAQGLATLKSVVESQPASASVEKKSHPE